MKQPTACMKHAMKQPTACSIAMLTHHAQGVNAQAGSSANPRCKTALPFWLQHQAHIVCNHITHVCNQLHFPAAGPLIIGAAIETQILRNPSAQCYLYVAHRTCKTITAHRWLRVAGRAGAAMAQATSTLPKLFAFFLGALLASAWSALVCFLFLELSSKMSASPCTL
jgi:hypothetical protein